MAGPVYVVFDGDEDKYAYAFMKGWKANNNVDFDFEDAHDLDSMTARARRTICKEQASRANAEINGGRRLSWEKNKKLA